MSLRSFLKLMEEKVEVSQIGDEVSPKFEFSCITRGFGEEVPVLLFENVEGNKTKVVANVCVTRNLICAALSVERSFIKNF